MRRHCIYRAAGAVLAGALAAGAAVSCAPQSRFPAITAEQAQAEAEKQREIVVAETLKLNERLLRVSHPVLRAGAGRCGERVARRLGVSLGADGDDRIPEDYRATYRRLGNLAGQPTVVAAPKAFAGGRAGLESGDVIVKLDGKPLPGGRDGIDVLIDGVRAGTGDAALEIRRGPDTLTLTVAPDVLCDYPVSVKRHDSVNAFADGSKIVITSGMARFVDSDDELALVIGHELAHNTETHIAAKMGNVLIGALIGAIISGLTGVNVTDGFARAGGEAFSQDFESEADYIGAYFAAMAGYDVKGAATLWRRMGAAHPQAIHLSGSTHPSTAKRFVAIEQTVAEIEKKRAQGLPLVPETKASAGGEAKK